MDEFLSSIKQKYKERRVNREKQWPPCHSNMLLRLELVERKKGAGYCDNIQRGSDDKTVKQTSLAYGDLFKVERDKKPVRKVLVEGDAGIGKTTLSVSITEDWSCERLFQEFELVLLLPLRQKKVASASSLPELLKLLHPSADVCKSVASYLEKSEAKKVLVIADGWDELSESDRQAGSGSFLYEILFETFPLMSVVVTSRPFASAPLHRLPCFDRSVEINGFGKDDIKEYIHCEFSSDHEKAYRLLEQLEDNPLVESVCSVPLNCAIICHLWRTSEKALPSTMTQLYTKMILNVILRNIQKKDSCNNVSNLPNFDALPKELQQSFKLLCKFAFEAMKKNQIVFSQEELVEFLPEGFALDEKILCFGLLQSAETVLETGHGVSFHFLHLTIMEYLAALHLSEQTESTQPCFSLFNANIVWRFFFGFSTKEKGENISTNVSEYAKNFITKISNGVALSLCRCAFECQNDFFTLKISELLERHIRSFRKISYAIQTAYDFSAVLYVMAKMEECSHIQLHISHCGVRENQIRRLTDILARKQGKLSVAELSLSCNKLTGECVSDLFHRASAAFKADEEHFHGGDTQTLIPSTSTGLSYLNLNHFRSSELQVLENVVRNKIFSHLLHLHLEGCLTSTDDHDTNATLLTTFIEALTTNCPHMEELDLSSNNLGVSGASVVAKGVSRFLKYNGFHLYLDDTRLGDEGFERFFDNLNGVYYFSVLSINGNSIHAAGVLYLAESVCLKRILMSKSPICVLELSDNPLGLEGAIAVGRMLSSSYCEFTEIHLCRCKLTTAGSAFSNTDSVSLGSSISSESAVIDIGEQLCLMPQNTTITNLDLSGNSFTGEGIHILFGIMHLCIHLVELDCTDCGITSEDLKLLLDKISQLQTSSPDHHHQLSSWDLSNNKIDDRSLIDRLSATLEHCTSLYYDGNSISSQVRVRLGDEVEKS